MRKLIVLLLAISLLGIAPGQAAVKAGAICKKVGVIATVSGKKFTCIKRSGKLVWNRGVTIKTAATINTGVCPLKLAADKNSGISQVRADALIAMTEAEAERCAIDLGWIYRIGQRDNQLFAGTFDYRIDRVTVTVMKGVVSQVNVG